MYILSLLHKIFNKGKNNHRVVKFPNLNSGAMSSTSIEIQIYDLGRVLKGISRGKREKNKVYCGILCCLRAAATIN